MLRDFKYMRRNSGKSQDFEEIENVPINPNNDSTNDNEVSGKSKFERTPVRSKTNTPAIRTPERQGLRKRFGFSGANDGGRDEGRSEMSRNGGGTLNLTPRVVSGVTGKGATTSNATTTYSGYSECASTQTTPNKSVSKPPNPGYAPWSSSRHLGNASVARGGGSYGALVRGGSSGQICGYSSVDVPHFDLKEDESFWMHHNVQVILRVRPLNNIERSTQGYNRCVKQESAQSITWIGQPETRFTFDHVACETIDQEMLFRMAGRPIVENCLSGYNSCMFAYGQTGSGKTYTMLGDMENVDFKPSSHRGMAPRIFEFLFARINSEEELGRDEKLKYSCRCSFLEIYNEQITDLLDPSSTNLLLREDVKNGVYVENLSEFEVHSVEDVLRLLIQGSSNRRVAATNMNRESSRSHSVFTCIITSKWEKDSTINQRFARLNLVDLAGSERQKSSGAEGERLKEAANINKSLSTLGHVIMLLVDIAQGKPKHIPYRDSRLTFLLQDSLGGNSKTMIIANISPSSCCAAETLNTLKFAQRAKMIQNNAVVNEDSSGDVTMLQHQIWLLKEELSALKRQKNPSRALAFDSSCTARCRENVDIENPKENDHTKSEGLLGSESKGSLQVSSKQLKSLELMLAGALRREQTAESTIKKLEAEIEQLNRLVRQREEDTRSTKMQLKFREDKIQRMESLVGGLKPVDAYLLEENAALSEEIQLLRAKADRNPEVTRFAVENIRLLEQLRRFQDFYEEGERDILLQEITELRSQLIQSIDNNSQQHNHGEIVRDATSNGKENESIRSELTCTLNELAECQRKLQSCLETNAKLSSDIEDLQAHLRNKEPGSNDHLSISNALKEMQAPCIGAQAFDENSRNKNRDLVRNAEEIVNLELELEILKIILKEERVLRGKMEETTFLLNRDVQLAEERVMLMRRQWEDTKCDLNEAKSLIEALEAQQLLSISEIDDLKSQNSRYMKRLHQQELQTAALREQRYGQESTFSSLKHSEADDSPLHLQLQRMQASLDKAKQINMLFQSDHATQISNEEEMDEIRRQAEAETAEVIVCLQDELCILQQRVEESGLREKEAESRLLSFEKKYQELQETSDMMSCENEALRQSLLDKNMEIKSLLEDWELLSCEIEKSLIDGHDALTNASDQIASISFSNRRAWVSEQFGKMVRHISDKELAFEELNNCLEDANTRANEMEHMLMSLRDAVMIMTESHEQVCHEKEKEIQQLRSELMAHLLTEEENILMCEKKDGESKEKFEAGVLSLQAVFTDFFNTCESKILDLGNKLHTVEGCTQEVKYSWIQKKELLESQLVEAEEEMLLCDKKYCESKEIVEAGVRDLQAAFTDFENECETKILVLDHKLCKVEGCAQEAKSSWCQMKGLLESQLVDAEEDMLLCEKKHCESKEVLEAGVQDLQAAFTDFQNKCETKILALDHKLCKVEGCAQETKDSWCQTKELLEFQLLDANAMTAHNSIEASRLLARFEEAQDTIKEADIMINGLMIANETLKLQVEDLRNLNITLTSQRDNLLAELQEAHDLNDQTSRDLENQLQLEVSQSMSLFEELQSIVTQVQDATEEAFVSLTCDLNNIKSEIRGNVKMMHSSLEDIWSQIFMKDCAISVLHLCHMGVLLEAVTSLNAENGLLHHGIRESNQAIHDLRACNMKSNKELEMCRLLKGKLLSDFKTSFDCVLNKEGETKEMNCKLDSFSEKLLVLQQQEELMLERSNFMNSELSRLMEELSQSNSQMIASLEEQEESFTVEGYAKDFELLILTSKLQELADYRVYMEGERINFQVAMDYFMSEILTLQINANLKEHISFGRETDTISVHKRVGDAEGALAKVLTQFQTLEAENVGLKDRLKMKDNDLENLQNGMFLLQTSSSDLQNKLLTVESEYELLQNELLDRKRENSVMLEAIQELHEESHRKDEVINGLMFDLRLSQELAANNKDQKDKIEELSAILDSRDSELATKSHELDEALCYGQVLEAKVKSQDETLSTLEMDLKKSQQSVNIVSDENVVLRSQVENITAEKRVLESELAEQKSINDGLENELLEMGNTLSQVNDLVESLKNNLDEVKNEKDELQKELLILEGKVETAHALAEENEAIAAEAQEIAESRRVYAEEKEEEVELLERSVQELDSTISVLENKVDVLKGDAEKQRLQREELEPEIQALKTQMLNVESADADIKRHFDEKSRNLQESVKRIQILEKDLKNKDTEIAKCKSHISELTLHAEAQASTYKHKFKELEAMIEQLKSEEASGHEKISSSNKLEKNTSKGRGSASPFKGKGSGSPFKTKGSGSPFKCIGIGLAHQFKSEKDEEFNAERQRIVELEALAASRQKEIFMLNAKLATAESMTHDVIRDLVGVKLDMSSYATLLDKQKAQKITEKSQLVGEELQEVNELKKQLNEFIEERKGWLVDINGKQAEVVAAQTALQNLHQQEQILTSENELLKVEIQNHKKRVMELEGELKKVSGQQNLHQRIHHHAKIKEENNVLKVQNEDLCHRLRRAESLLSRIKEELAHYRANNGKNPHFNFDEEQRLKNMLKETKQEKQYLAQTLLGLCTNILKAAGVTKPTSEVDLSAAEEALQKLVTQVTSLERELKDLKLKLKITNERVRLAELMPETSPYNSRSGDSRQTPRRASQSPFFSAIDR